MGKTLGYESLLNPFVLLGKGLLGITMIIVQSKVVVEQIFNKACLCYIQTIKIKVYTETLKKPCLPIVVYQLITFQCEVGTLYSWEVNGFCGPNK